MAEKEQRTESRACWSFMKKDETWFSVIGSICSAALTQPHRERKTSKSQDACHMSAGHCSLQRVSQRISIERLSNFAVVLD